MKLLCAEYNEQGSFTVGVIGDNALLRNNNDFYFPAFTRELSCVPQLVFRACKLGKGVSERFAGRYYNEVGVGLRFYADTLESELKMKGLPCGVAAAFDDSAAQSELRDYQGENIKYSLQVNETTVFTGTMRELPLHADEFVALASGFYMIKIGDFFYCGNPYRYRGLQIGDRLRMYMGEECMMDFHIR
ncbi:fumarylacetoacetate hydrolase [Culturomica massiliensis]|uniref:fumarylacetoacetate hydrolase n=1 Tax=Culturomica massiliensis TaxID=1841857 RepID=UPI00266EF7FE|nr:fumarylacetoacetate hydrolase [Culturomica massiliensis]